MDNIFQPLVKEDIIIKHSLASLKYSSAELRLIELKASKLIELIRADRKFSIEEFVQRFSLDSEEGVAIICLAEALLRIMDKDTAFALSQDKLANKSWEKFLFKPAKSFKSILASGGLYLAGKYTDILKSDNILTNLVNKLGKASFISALKLSIKYLSSEFVFAEDMDLALKKSHDFVGYKFSFDLLGESARTDAQASRYYEQYLKALDLIASAYSNTDLLLWDRPNLSVKLTALCPRFELKNIKNIEKELLPKVIHLIKKMHEYNITISFDAEESSRLDTYILFLTKLIESPEIQDYQGIGLVVQAYQVRSQNLIEYIIKLAQKTNKQIAIRLVKGAYWDSEIKRAQELGVKNYPVFTKKEYTDFNYLVLAKKMLENNQYIYSQFATHNAITASSILAVAGNQKFEFQKLYGMGNRLHAELLKDKSVRIYAPVGKSNDLLAYLMRRMLENGANNNFVGKVVDKDIKISDLIVNLHDKVLKSLSGYNKIKLPEDIYQNRKNAMGYDLGHKNNYDYINEKVSSYFNNTHVIGSIINGKEFVANKNLVENFCPGRTAEKFSSTSVAIESEIIEAIDFAHQEFEANWRLSKVEIRVKILNKIADLLEDNKFELYAILIKEAGKSIEDAINEVIEAIDFCRYYALLAKTTVKEVILPGLTGEKNILTMHGRGVFLCISPWNFPLAIFTGQIVAALVSGNSVIVKSASQTPVIASFTVKLMHKAGVPKAALNLLITSGSNISKYVLNDPRIAGVAFTGSCQTARDINISLAQRDTGIVPLIAETGGQNAMIVDSSALLEQVTDDVLTSAFYSAGQRCSALRVLYIQEEIYDELLTLIKDATELLQIGDTSDFAVDIGPVIDKKSFVELTKHLEYMKGQGFNVIEHHNNNNLKDGNYFYPHIIEIDSINDIPDENFGPILHVIKYHSSNLDKIIEEVNNYGFGLTFGIHSRIESKLEYIRSKVKVGNIYANRSIVGAKVESQPFGGENKSGTGFKAGGPHYLLRFMTERVISVNLTAIGGNIELLNDDL